MLYLVETFDVLSGNYQYLKSRRTISDLEASQIVLGQNYLVTKAIVAKSAIALEYCKGLTNDAVIDESPIILKTGDQLLMRSYTDYSTGRTHYAYALIGDVPVKTEAKQLHVEPQSNKTTLELRVEVLEKTMASLLDVIAGVGAKGDTDQQSVQGLVGPQGVEGPRGLPV